MLITIEGIYKDGKIVLLEQPAGIHEAKVVVTFLNDSVVKAPSKMLHYGMFAGPNMSTEEDFKLAEWHGEPEFDDQYK